MLHLLPLINKLEVDNKISASRVIGRTLNRTKARIMANKLHYAMTITARIATFTSVLEKGRTYKAAVLTVSGV